MVEPISAAVAAPFGDELSLHFARIPVTRISLDRPSQQQFDLDAMLSAARLLADARVHAICWNGISAAWKGSASDRWICDAVQRETGIPATSATLAQLEAFRVRGIRRFGLAVPYRDDVRRAIVRVYREEGFECVSSAHLGIKRQLRVRGNSKRVAPPARAPGRFARCGGYCGDVAPISLQRDWSTSSRRSWRSRCWIVCFSLCGIHCVSSAGTNPSLAGDAFSRMASTSRSGIGPEHDAQAGQVWLGRARELRVVLAALAAGKPILLLGLPGVSKTTIVREVATRLGLDRTSRLFTATGDEQLTAFSMVGSFDPALVLRDGFKPEYFVPGPLVQAMGAGGILYVEELNRAPSGV